MLVGLVDGTACDPASLLGVHEADRMQLWRRLFSQRLLGGLTRNGPCGRIDAQPRVGGFLP